MVGVLFMAVANAAPITAMSFNTPIGAGYGNGIGVPAGFFFATIVLTIFTIGFAAMSKHITTTGAFYGFISHGLGQPWGMAAGLLAKKAVKAAIELAGTCQAELVAVRVIPRYVQTYFEGSMPLDPKAVSQIEDQWKNEAEKSHEPRCELRRSCGGRRRDRGLSRDGEQPQNLSPLPGQS